MIFLYKYILIVLEFIVEKEAELPKVIQTILDEFKDEKIWLFYGNVGAGKTTFIKQLVAKLGVSDLVQSPTFSIVNHYGDSIYHFDLYRLKTLEESLDIGIEEYLESGNYCFIEWPDLILPILPDTFLKLEIITLENEFRKIMINKMSNV